MKTKILIHSRIDRICHWTMVFLISFLLTSGFYIHHPINLGSFYNMGLNIFLQTTCGIIATGVFAVWMYYKVITQGYKEIWVRKRDLSDMLGLFKYYFFIENKSPGHGKYNAGQKMVFTSWFFMFGFMAISGLVLYSVNHGYILPFPVIIQKLRFYHFLAACYFLGTIPLHVYLSVTEDPAKLQAIFTGWVKK